MGGSYSQNVVLGIGNIEPTSEPLGPLEPIAVLAEQDRLHAVVE